MGLILPRGPDWGFSAHNWGSNPAATTLGTEVTAGADNADGTAVEILPALSRDVEYLKFYFGSAETTGAIVPDIMGTILIDPAGGTSWQTLIPDLLMGRVRSAVLGDRPLSSFYDFPLWIPAGASVGIMARTSHSATLTNRVVVLAYGGNASPASWWCGQRVTAVGANAAASSGTPVTAGNGVFGDWTNIGSPLSADCGAVQLAATSEGDNSWGASDVLIEWGVGGTAYGPPIMRSHSSIELAMAMSAGINFKRLPAGAQLQARASENGSSTAPGVAIYAVH